jgi:hypothetical protein
MVLRLEKTLMREYHSMSAPVDSTPSNITRRRHASTANSVFSSRRTFALVDPMAMHHLTFQSWISVHISFHRDP